MSRSRLPVSPRHQVRLWPLPSSQLTQFPAPLWLSQLTKAPWQPRGQGRDAVRTGSQGHGSLPPVWGHSGPPPLLSGRPSATPAAPSHHAPQVLEAVADQRRLFMTSLLPTWQKSNRPHRCLSVAEEQLVPVGPQLGSLCALWSPQHGLHCPLSQMRKQKGVAPPPAPRPLQSAHREG